MGRLLKLGCLGIVAIGVVVGVALAVTLSGGGDGGGGGSSEDTYKVVYEVGGDAERADMTFTTTGTGSISQENGKPIPWSKTLTFDDEPFAFYSVSAQNRGGGKLTCTVTVNGEEVVTNTASGRFAIVSCDSSSE